jgi:hypothetical protein
MDDVSMTIMFSTCLNDQSGGPDFIHPNQDPDFSNPDFSNGHTLLTW